MLAPEDLSHDADLSAENLFGFVNRPAGEPA
jgi:hypothetical protein